MLAEEANLMSLLRFGGWANLAIAAGHLVALGWAWTIFRWVDIEEPMRDLADQNAALPYFLTLFVAAFFLIFGLYALSAAGDLRRLLPLEAGGSPRSQRLRRGDACERTLTPRTWWTHTAPLP